MPIFCLLLYSDKSSWTQISKVFNAIKDRINPTLNSYYYKDTGNNNSIYKQGSMNISEDITIKTNIKQNGDWVEHGGSVDVFLLAPL